MKISAKQIAIAILCIIIAFIPTYIAVTYYFVKDSAPADGYYSVSITDEADNEVLLNGTSENKLADVILKINKRMRELEAAPSADELSESYFNITVSSVEGTSEYRYYFSTEKDTSSIVYDKGTDQYFIVDFDDAKAFLTLPCAYPLYASSALPTLSIFGGDDVMPTEASWKYKTVSGSMVDSKSFETVNNASIHAMNSNTKLSFSVAPDRCSVRVTQNGIVIAEGDSLSCIPYEKLNDGSVSFEIHAEWSSEEYSGYAKYRFTSTVGLAPEFFINKTSIQSGEFVLVYAKNISAPQKIEFTSSPAINYTPVFFEENGLVYALIPIDKNLDAPQTYTFEFKYGDMTSVAVLNVTQREIKERDYDCASITAGRTAEAIESYHRLLSEIGLKYETTRYFSDKFIDYSLEYTSDIAKIVLGYGHRRIPSNGDTPFRLDGVDYFIASGTNVTAIASGKVVAVGADDLLGKYVVIDHGLGLKTWYCNMSETLTTVGAIIAKGDAVGKPGTTGYKNTGGVFLITTVMNVPVCPYALQEDGLVLPR